MRSPAPTPKHCRTLPAHPVSHGFAVAPICPDSPRHCSRVTPMSSPRNSSEPDFQPEKYSADKNRDRRSPAARAPMPTNLHRLRSRPRRSSRFRSKNLRKFVRRAQRLPRQRYSGPGLGLTPLCSPRAPRRLDSLFPIVPTAGSLLSLFTSYPMNSLSQRSS